MSAIAKTQVSLVKGSDRYVGGGVRPRTVVQRRVMITGVTAGDTATADVLGFGKITDAMSAVTQGNPDSPLLVGVSQTANTLIIGTGPANATVHVTVQGTPSIRKY